MEVINRGQFHPELFENGQNNEEVPVRLMRKPTTVAETCNTSPVYRFPAVIINHCDIVFISHV